MYYIFYIPKTVVPDLTIPDDSTPDRKRARSSSRSKVSKKSPPSKRAKKSSDVKKEEEIEIVSVKVSVEGIADLTTPEIVSFFTDKCPGSKVVGVKRFKNQLSQTVE